MSFFTYALDNPIQNVDPMGLMASAAHICCDGSGGFKICWDNKPDDQLLVKCMEAHEWDHKDWLEKHKQCPCKDKPPGYKFFEMTKDEQADIECRGYMVEYRCLRKNGASGGSAAFNRWNQLTKLGKDRFKCKTDQW